MSYSRKNWQCNELISASALNNIEDGIEEALNSGGGGGITIIPVINNVNTGEWIVDLSPSEVVEAYVRGDKIFLYYNNSYNLNAMLSEALITYYTYLGNEDYISIGGQFLLGFDAYNEALKIAEFSVSNYDPLTDTRSDSNWFTTQLNLWEISATRIIPAN